MPPIDSYLGQLRKIAAKMKRYYRFLDLDEIVSEAYLVQTRGISTQDALFEVALRQALSTKYGGQRRHSSRGWISVREDLEERERNQWFARHKEPEPLSALVKIEEARNLHSKIAAVRLSSRRRTILELRARGLSCEEIGLVVDRTVQQVWSEMQEIRDKIQAAW